jgi:uncharacterized protein (TIGR03032 family)
MPHPDSLAQALATIAQLGQSGRISEAIALCQQILAQHPDTAKAWHFLGLAALQQGNAAEAVTHLERAIALDATIPEFHNHAGVAYCSVGDFANGILAYERSLELFPDALDTRFNLALALQKQEHWDAAIHQYQEIVARHSRYLPALYQLGNVYQRLHRYQAAIAQYHQVLVLKPDYAEAHYNLGVALQAQGESEAAIHAYQQALVHKPDYGDALNALGAALQEQGQASRAIAQYEKALTLNPDYIPALLNLGSVYLRLDQLDAAESGYRRILQLDSTHLRALEQLVDILRRSCRWGELQELETLLIQGLERAIAQQDRVEFSPYHSLFMPVDGAQQQAIATYHAQALQQKMGELRKTLAFSGVQASSGRIRLGYVSGDLRHHAVAQLMLRLFELHDRQRFEVFAYSLGPDDGSEYRQKLRQDADVFRDVRGMALGAIAQQIRQDQVQILVDLAGYTDYARPELFHLGLAPVQVNYLGYPGTLGTSAVDYIITDAVLTPLEMAETLTEHCVYLPHSYQINNNQQPVPNRVLVGDRPTARTQAGLPAEGFVFCCFNKAEKLEPSMFKVWMEILQQVPGSVLWLLGGNHRAEQELHQLVQASGLGGDRLIFAPRVSKEEHLQRHQLADLFLDTRYYNAHTTGSDALWAGLPMITLAGNTFASRVGASLLSAVGLPHLIAQTLDDYAQLAIHLAHHPEELDTHRTHLEQQRFQLPLFQTEHTVRHLEAAYQAMGQRVQNQEPSCSFHISADGQVSWGNALPPLRPVPIQDAPVHPFASDPSASPIATPSTPTRSSPAMATPSTAENKASETIGCQADAGFQAWMSRAGGSVVISTYQAGKVVMVGWNGQQITILLRHFEKPMGMAIAPDRLALATRHEVMFFANAKALAHNYLEDQPGRYDTLFLPRASYFTGDLNVHDLGFVGDELWMVNTRFSCLATLSYDYSFLPQWQPAFISELAPEDRCHLNGLAIAHGKPKYVTALGESNVVGGWRENKASGGIVIDVETQDIIQRELSMPHSPQWYQEALWVLNSGAGELVRINPQTGERDVICTLPGFGRGLCFVGDRALIGLCQIREQHIFGGLPIQERFAALKCGVAIVNLNTGVQEGFLEFTAGCRELYDVKFLPAHLRPTILNLEKDATRDGFTAPTFAYWLRPSALVQDHS